MQFPHCDPRILHAPGRCEYCDRLPEWQALRKVWNIAYTGQDPIGTETRCPAEAARGRENLTWHGNVAKSKPTVMDADLLRRMLEQLLTAIGENSVEDSRV